MFHGDDLRGFLERFRAFMHLYDPGTVADIGSGPAAAGPRRLISYSFSSEDGNHAKKKSAQQKKDGACSYVSYVCNSGATR